MLKKFWATQKLLLGHLINLRFHKFMLYGNFFPLAGDSQAQVLTRKKEIENYNDMNTERKGGIDRTGGYRKAFC